MKEKSEEIEKIRKEVVRANTSIKIDPEVWKEARIQAIKEDTTVSELLERLVKEYIEKKKEER